MVGGGTVNLCGTEGGGTLWSSAGFGLRLGEQVELVDIGLWGLWGLYWPQLPELQLPRLGGLLTELAELAELAQVWPEMELLAEDQLPAVSITPHSYSGE